MKKFILLLMFVFLFGQFQILAQSTPSIREVQPQNHAWLMYFGTHSLSPKWSLHLEAQARRADGLTPQQWLLRTGINYHLLPNSTITLGYCWVNTYPYGHFPVKSIFPENRIWQQFQNKNQLGKVEWISRFRLEQRWLYLPILEPTSQTWSPGNSVFSQRFRSLQRFSIPLNGTKIEDHSWYLSFYDEIFIQFGKHVGFNVFDQNRAYFAIGTKIPKIGRLEIGYLNQLLLKSNGLQVENNHTLQIGLNANIPFHS